ncbi:15432_t:CDS:2 [Entrophospora sp. SA101]|nr:15432_t:CDS:2 [Entrophospora sp. SA101]
MEKIIGVRYRHIVRVKSPRVDKIAGIGESNEVNLNMLIINVPNPPQNLRLSNFMGNRLVKKYRSPNAFILYRREFLNKLRSYNSHINMSEVSKVASRHWRNESEEIKSKYKKMAKKLNNEYLEIQAHNTVYKFDEVITPLNYR